MRYQKLEKAEILELTVNYIRNANESLVHPPEHYEHGYQHCSEEFWQFIHSYPHLSSHHRQYLIDHCRQTWMHRRYSSPKLWKPYI